MQNSNSAVSKTVPPLIAESWRLGREDARMGRPYREEYHTWSRIFQENYEVGRLACVNVKMIGKTPHPYSELVKPRKVGGKIGVRPLINRQTQESYRNIGIPFPPLEASQKDLVWVNN